MKQDVPSPGLQSTMELIQLITLHAERNGYDAMMGLMKVVDAFNTKWRENDRAKGRKLGSVGFFPNGAPLNPDDNGAGMCMVEKRPDGIVYIELGQLVVNWLALTPQGARELGETLIKCADKPTPPPERDGHPRLAGLP